MRRVITALCAIITILISACATSVVETRTPTPDAAATQAAQRTVHAEHTLIAIYTQNPTLALSSTPFFAEVIAHQIVRDLTNPPTIPPAILTRIAQRTPVPTRDLTLELNQEATSWYSQLLGTPLMTPEHTYTPSATRDRRCWPVINTAAQYSHADLLKAAFAQRDLEANVFIRTIGVSGIDELCRVPFQPLDSNFSISIIVQDADDLEEIISKAEIAVSVLVEQHEVLYALTDEPVALAWLYAYADIFFDEQDDADHYYVMRAQYSDIIAAHTQGLTGQALIDALGGLERLARNR